MQNDLITGETQMYWQKCKSNGYLVALQKAHYFCSMTLDQFKSTLHASIPGSLSVYLESLWYDGKGDWEKSHTIIQDVEDKNAAWIHAYLHRKEGDIWNADYWYRRAGKTRPSFTLQEEWDDLVKAFL